MRERNLYIDRFTPSALRNFCMLHDDEAWRLSPAFDLVLLDFRVGQWEFHLSKRSNLSLSGVSLSV